MQVLFWVCAGLIFYTYFGYPILLYLAYAWAQIRRDWEYLKRRGDRRVRSVREAELPGVSFVIPAYNEEAVLPAKIENLRQLDYPKEKLEVIFVSDGSTDGTNRILESLKEPNFRVILQPQRQGKGSTLNQAVVEAHHPILLFSDTSTLFAPDSVRKLARHFTDPKVGGVCGALRFENSPESGQTEGFYWKYESMLRLMEARLGATLTASGAIYALRRECYDPVSADTVIEDFVIPMNARRMGFAVHYDPEAVATETAASTVAGEFTRRVRLAVGSFRAMKDLAGTPLPVFTRLALFSHKFLRWMVPFFLIGSLVTSGLLWNHPVYRILFVAQMLFYLWALLGFFFRHRLQKVRYALTGYFLIAMNLAFLVGFIRFLTGRKEVTWERVS